MEYYDRNQRCQFSFDYFIIHGYFDQFKGIFVFVSLLLIFKPKNCLNIYPPASSSSSFVIFAIVALISIWTLNALYLGLTVFISDFCVNPDDNTLEMANQNNIKPSRFFFNPLTPPRLIISISSRSILHEMSNKSAIHTISTEF